MAFSPLLMSFGKIGFSALLMGLAVDVFYHFFADFGDWFVIIVGAVCGMALYLGLAVLLRTREMGWVKEIVMKKLSKKCPPQAE